MSKSCIIDDTYAEAFDMRYCRLLVTAEDSHWLNAAVAAFAGFATSVIACEAEIGVEEHVAGDRTPDGRLGVNLLVFGFPAKQLEKSVVARAGQCLMTCPTTAVYDGSLSLPWSNAATGNSTAAPGEAAETVGLGRQLRLFGDGFQKSKKLGNRRLWRIPVMDGEFLVDDEVGIHRGIAGGNLILQCVERAEVLRAARDAVEAIAELPGVITPFPAGVVRCGSKVGSRYPQLKASTNEAYCPSLVGRAESQLHPDANAACEIVIDAVDRLSMVRAMKAGLDVARAQPVVSVAAGNYGGNLGKHHFHLREIINAVE